MVSDALVQFGLGFADAYGARRKPYHDALAREEATREITMSRNLEKVNTLISNDIGMQTLSTTERESVAKRMAASLDATSLSQIGKVQAQGGSIFSIGDKGPYAAGDGKFVSIGSLTKPVSVPKDVKELEAFKRVSARLYLVDTKTKGNLIAAWKSLDMEERERARSWLDRNKADKVSRINLALIANYIDRKGPVSTQEETVDSYTFNKNWASSAEGVAVLGQLGITDINKHEALIKFIYSDTISLLRARQYRNAFTGNAEAAKALIALRKPVKDATSILTQIDQASMEAPEDTAGNFGGQNIKSVAVSLLTSKYTVDYFKNLIKVKDDRPRNKVIDIMTENILNNFKSNQYIVGDETEAKRAIREYLSTQYDLASDRSTQ